MNQTVVNSSSDLEQQNKELVDQLLLHEHKLTVDDEKDERLSNSTTTDRISLSVVTETRCR